MSESFTYGDDEVPPFAFCESIAAGSASRVHIRRITPGVGLKLGGGIDTPSLCERVKRGWDLRMRIQRRHVEQDVGEVCEACRLAYLAAVGK